MEKNLTTGSVGRQLIGFSLPYLLSYLLQTLYGMADLFIIGQYEGVAGTTAVAVGSQVMHMLTVMIVGLAMGTTVSIARAIGADDRPQAAAATGNTVTLFLSLSLVLTAGLLLLRRPITAVMSTPEAAVGIVEKIIGFLFLVPSSMLSAVSALGAQNLGAGKPERAKQTLFWAIGLACGFGVVTVVAVQFLAEALVGLFTPDQAAVLAGGQYLRGYIWDSFFAGVQFSFSGYCCPCRGSRTFCRTATWAASRRSFASRSRRSPGGSRSSRASSARSTTACASCARRRRRSSTGSSVWTAAPAACSGWGRRCASPTAATCSRRSATAA